MRALLLLLVSAVAAAACGEHRIQAAPAASAPAAQLVVTTGYGSSVLHDTTIAPGGTVIAALESVTAVTTRYGGRFVQSIDGREGSADRGEDWLYFVNGIEAGAGGADVTVGRDDHIWWDFRRWTRYIHVPVVVGAWPEPFVHGSGARGVTADPPLDAALRAAGGRLAPTATCRVLVGSQADVERRSPAWREAAAAPQEHGLTAWIEAGHVSVWDAGRQSVRAVPGGRAVAAAVLDGDCATMVVAGLDPGAATAAATRIASDPAVLAHRYAVVFSAVGAPVAYGGAG